MSFILLAVSCQLLVVILKTVGTWTFVKSGKIWICRGLAHALPLPVAKPLPVESNN